MPAAMVTVIERKIAMSQMRTHVTAPLPPKDSYQLLSWRATTSFQPVFKPL